MYTREILDCGVMESYLSRVIENPIGEQQLNQIIQNKILPCEEVTVLAVYIKFEEFNFTVLTDLKPVDTFTATEYKLLRRLMTANGIRVIEYDSTHSQIKLTVSHWKRQRVEPFKLSVRELLLEDNSFKPEKGFFNRLGFDPEYRKCYESGAERYFEKGIEVGKEIANSLPSLSKDTPDIQRFYKLLAQLGVLFMNDLNNNGFHCKVDITKASLLHEFLNYAEQWTSVSVLIEKE